MHVALYAVAAILGIVAYMFIAFSIVGPLSWRVWFRGKNDLLSYLFFPSSTRKGRVGKYCGYWHSNCPLLTQVEQGYAGAYEEYMMASLWWPVRLAWSVVNLAPIAALLLCVSVAVTLCYVVMTDGRDAASACFRSMRDDWFPPPPRARAEPPRTHHAPGVRVK